MRRIDGQVRHYPPAMDRVTLKTAAPLCAKVTKSARGEMQGSGAGGQQGRHLPNGRSTAYWARTCILLAAERLGDHRE
jgi:hypothetical protein